MIYKGLRYSDINDTYGHQTGDAVILAISDTIRSIFRTDDIAMRLGGDEFGVFAAGISSKETGKALIERLFGRIESLTVPELRGEKIFVSAGAVIFPEGEETSFRELYAIADDALYRSKKSSGNSLTFGKTGGKHE